MLLNFSYLANAWRKMFLHRRHGCVTVVNDGMFPLVLGSKQRCTFQQNSIECILWSNLYVGFIYGLVSRSFGVLLILMRPTKWQKRECLFNYCDTMSCREIVSIIPHLLELLEMSADTMTVRILFLCYAAIINSCPEGKLPQHKCILSCTWFLNKCPELWVS